VSRELYTVLAYAFMLGFIICCLGSAILQIIAWFRQTPPGSKVRLRALWRPETGPFNEIGLRQMQAARSLLIVGIVAYLFFGALIVASRILGVE